jgi:hypothetical protein
LSLHVSTTPLWPKIAKLFFIKEEVISPPLRRTSMRIAQTIFAGSIAVLAALASPALANGSSPNSHANANAQAVEGAPASSGCHAYQKGPDGSWIEIACHEGSGSDAAPLPVRKSAGHASGQNAR